MAKKVKKTIISNSGRKSTVYKNVLNNLENEIKKQLSEIGDPKKIDKFILEKHTWIVDQAFNLSEKQRITERDKTEAITGIVNLWLTDRKKEADVQKIYERIKETVNNKLNIPPTEFNNIVEKRKRLLNVMINDILLKDERTRENLLVKIENSLILQFEGVGFKNKAESVEKEINKRKEIVMNEMKNIPKIIEDELGNRIITSSDQPKIKDEISKKVLEHLEKSAGGPIPTELLMDIRQTLTTRFKLEFFKRIPAGAAEGLNFLNEIPNKVKIEIARGTKENEIRSMIINKANKFELKDFQKNAEERVNKALREARAGKIKVPLEELMAIKKDLQNKQAERRK